MDEELPIGTVLVNLDVEYMVAEIFGVQREATGNFNKNILLQCTIKCIAALISVYMCYSLYNYIHFIL